MNMHKNARLTRRAVESGLCGGWRAGRRGRLSPKAQVSARGPFVSGLIDIAEKDWQGCTTAHPGRIGRGSRHPRPSSRKSSGAPRALDG